MKNILLAIALIFVMALGANAQSGKTDGFFKTIVIMITQTERCITISSCPMPTAPAATMIQHHSVAVSLSLPPSAQYMPLHANERNR